MTVAVWLVKAGDGLISWWCLYNSACVQLYPTQCTDPLHSIARGVRSTSEIPGLQNSPSLVARSRIANHGLHHAGSQPNVYPYTGGASQPRASSCTALSAHSQPNHPTDYAGQRTIA